MATRKKTPPAGVDPEVELDRRAYTRPQTPKNPTDRCSRVSVNGYRCDRVDKFVDVKNADGKTTTRLAVGCELYSRDCNDCDHYGRE